MSNKTFYGNSSSICSLIDNSSTEQARSQGGHSGAVVPNFFVPRKSYFKHTIKTKILLP